MPTKKYDLLFTDDEKRKMRLDYENGASIRDIQTKYEINSKSWIQNKLLKGITRHFSEASKMAHKKYPNRFKHTDKTKKLMREKRLAYMKEHPENTAWRKKNEPSYPEKCFIKFLEQNGYDKQYLIEREKSVFPFYIDFAFIQPMLAVEIDGSQHIKEEERIQRDLEKDELLQSKGWKVLRVTENLVKSDWVSLKKELEKMLGENSIRVEKVGIFTKTTVREKVKRGSDGLSEKMRESAIRQRKVKDRPTLEDLEKLLETLPMTKIGEMYGVSDSAIRKWLKQYRKTNNL